MRPMPHIQRTREDLLFRYDYWGTNRPAAPGPQSYLEVFHLRRNKQAKSS